MAIAEHEYKQKPLDRLGPPDENQGFRGFILPSPDSHELDDIEFFLDLDLDQFSVYWGDKSVPHDVEELSQRTSVLLDSNTERVLGITLSDFMGSAVKTHPELTIALRYATVISGDTVLSPSETPEIAKKHFRTRLADWLFRRTQNERRKAVFFSFADALGLC